MKKVTTNYRTRDGRADYRFSIEAQPDGTWVPFILWQPSYEGRNTGAHPTHRLTKDGRKHICWTAPLRSLADAKQVVALWSDATQRYIRTGKRF